MAVCNYGLKNTKMNLVLGYLRNETTVPSFLAGAQAKLYEKPFHE